MAVKVTIFGLGLEWVYAIGGRGLLKGGVQLWSVTAWILLHLHFQGTHISTVFLFISGLFFGAKSSSHAEGV